MRRTVKCMLLLPTLVIITSIVHAQTPKPGKYLSADGSYSISVSVTADGSIEIKEPTRTSIYKKEGNFYRHSDPKYSAYRIRVGANNDLYTSKEGSSNEYRFNWASNEEVVIEGCALYDKYTEKAEEGDEKEVQAWTFCAAAALAKCNYTEDGFKVMVKGIVASLKPILLDKKCPCEDVIPLAIWNAN